MKEKRLLSLAVVGLMSTWPLAATAQEPAKVRIPEPGVPQIMTMEGRYVRAAYNNEGYAILGYKLANLSAGEEWMLLEVGFALREGVPDYDLTRQAVSLDTPDGKTIPLPTIEEFRKGDVRALQARERVQRDSINYFPPNAYRACSIQFFTDVNSRAMAWDKVEMTNQRACLGRLYFPVPGGIKHGQYWLNVKFAQSTIRVPFRILTKEEDKYLEKNYRDIEKQVKEAFKKKG
jgi:small-conductance mechanosensitive channel